jgi:fatty-acid desaturase
MAGVADDVEAVANERLYRTITGTITAVPILSLALVAWQLWDKFLGWNDIFVFVLLYVLTGLGVTVGFHRLFTHRAFKTAKPVRLILAILGSAAIEGPVISWVADHRKHHAFSDQEGDPHSPHVGHGGGWRGALRGLVHAHAVCARSDQGPDRQLGRSHVPRLGDRRSRRGIRARLAVRRHATRWADRAAVGWSGSDAGAASRYLLDQLALPLLRAPPV